MVNNDRKEQMENIERQVSALHEEFRNMVCRMMKDGTATEQDLDIASKVSQHFYDILPLLGEMERCE